MGEHGLLRGEHRLLGQLGLLGLLNGGGIELGGQLVGQLHRQRCPDRKRSVIASNNGVFQRFPSLSSERLDGLRHPVNDAADHPPIAVDADETHHPGAGSDHLAAPRPVLDGNLGIVVAQRIGQLAGHLAPESGRLRRGVGSDGEAAIGGHDPNVTRGTHLVELHLNLPAGRHRDQHRPQIQTRQCRMSRVVEVLDIEGSDIVAGRLETRHRVDLDLISGLLDGLLERLLGGLLDRACVPVLLTSTECHHKLACPPEEPWPSWPRVVSASPASSNEATSTSSGSSTRWTSS